MSLKKAVYAGLEIDRAASAITNWRVEWRVLSKLITSAA